MGNHNSRRHSQLWNTEINRLKNAASARPYEVVYTCSLSVWSKSESSLWGFDPMINYTTRCDKRLQPWTTRGRYLTSAIPAPETQDIDMSAVCMYATMALSEKRNKYMVQCINLPVSYFKERVCFVELVAFMQDFAMLQVATERGRIDFLLIDLKRDVAKLVYTETCLDKPCLYECAVSYDLSKVIIKPNPLYAQLHDIKDCDDVIKCIDTPRNGHDLRVYNIIEGDALEVTFTFDPRFRHSRIALANIAKNDKILLCTFDVNKRTFVNRVELTPHSKQFAQKLTYNPEGTLLAALIRLGTTTYVSPYYFCGVKLYTSDTLESVCFIQQPEIQADITCVGYNHMTPAAIFPMFSTNGHFLAVSVGQPEYSNVENRLLNKISGVAIHKVPPTMNLEDICRYKIVSWVPQTDIKYLPLPDALKRYLLCLPQNV